jgi:hypothetical protein
MAKKGSRNATTPSPKFYPKSWEGVNSKTWQSQTGMWAARHHHICSYLAMFPPSLPHYFIRRFTKPENTILDPFCGRGTTPVAAASLNRIGIGNDLNPLAIALTRGKLSNPSLDDVLVRLDELELGYDSSEWKYFSGVPNKIRMIFNVNTLRQLMYMKRELDWSKPGIDSFITAVLLGALHGSSEGFLSVSMPNTFSMSWNYVKKFIKDKKLKKPDRDVFKVLRKRIERTLGEGKLLGKGKVFESDVRNLGEHVDPCTVDLLFTSPPYLKVIKYGLYNWIRLWYLDCNHEKVDSRLDDTHALKDYRNFMEDTLKVALPLIEPKKGFACWVIGDVGELNLAWEIWKVAESITIQDPKRGELKWKLLAIIDDEIPPEEKTTKMWKTLVHKVVRFDHDGVIVDVVAESTDAKEAQNILEMTEEIDDTSLNIITEKTNDKSGKATPIDRILIIAPEGSKPKSYVKDSNMTWKERTGRYSRRTTMIRRKILQDALDEVEQLKKIEILASIISHGKGGLEVDHFSDGSTVTKKGLEIPLPRKITKKLLLEKLLNHVGEELKERDYIEGGTVTTDALIRIYRGLLLQ